MVAGRTLRQTRSGTGHPHALGESFPRIRALYYVLHCCLQARLRTLPRSRCKRGNESSQIKIAGKKSRIEITLHGPNATGALVPAFGQLFLGVAIAAMTVLGQLGGTGRNFMQDAASSCNRAFQ